MKKGPFMRSAICSKSVSRRDVLKGGALSALAFCLPSRVFSAYEAAADAAENDVVLRFAAMSDIHFKKNADCAERERFQRAVAFMYDYSAKQNYPKFDALLVAGDMTDHGYDEEITLFKKTLDECVKPGTEKVICMGNHEFYSPAPQKERWEKVMQLPANKVYEVNGFRFVAISPEKGTCRDGDYKYALDWVAKELDAASQADPNKPIFVFQHYHITPTVYGSRGDDNWGIKDLYEPLQKYPNVINFSGHSHYPIADPRSAWQGRFTAFGTATLSYYEMGGEGGKYDKFPKGYREAAEFYVVEVRRDNSVVLKPYDLRTNAFFDFVYVVAKPGAVEEYLYTDERYKTSEKPVWPDGAQVVCKEAFPNGATLEFPQATCADVVHSYRVAIERREKDGAWKPFGEERFWSEYYFLDAPETMRVELGELDDDATYRLRVSALNPFFKESDKSLEVEIKTPVDPTETVDKNAAAPEANMLDVRVEYADGKARWVNAPTNGLETQKAIEVFGKQTFAVYPFVRGIFNGKDDYLKIKFDKRDYAKLRRGTIAAKFKLDAFSGGAADVFANTEGRGVSFEINGKNQTLEFWASIDGKYEILSTPIEVGKFYDVFGTYDGETLILYVDGKEVARKKKSGKLTHPTDEKLQAFCVGADISKDGKGTAFFKGSVVRARIFTWALSAEQVANLTK